jgi:nitrite reductase/ring-hydroxylating ferredoxin subunit
MTADPSKADGLLDPERWRDVCRADDLVEGQLIHVDIGRHSILLIRIDEGVSALQNVCPHEHCYLHKGQLEDGAIVCAGHSWRFDASTGQGIRPRRASLFRYETRIQDGRVYVALPVPKSRR